MASLSSCREGDVVRVVKLKGAGLVRRRLLDMGFMKGCELHIVKYAPLRDPMEVVIRDSHISLRVSEADFVDVDRPDKAPNDRALEDVAQTGCGDDNEERTL